MRRLDELLTHAADRGERMGPDRLIEHLQRRLEGEREVVVSGSTRRGTMVTTKERPRTSEIPERPRRRWALALTAFAVIAGAVAVVAIAIGINGNEEVTQERAIEIVQEFAEDFRNDDIAALEATSQNGTTDTAFIEWHHGLRANPEFTDCRITRDTVNGFVVACDVQYDPDSLFARMGSPSTAASIDVNPDGLIGVNSWPPPARLAEIGQDLRAFFEARYPELLDTIVGFDYAGLAWTREAGQVIDEHLDEFVAYTESQG